MKIPNIQIKSLPVRKLIRLPHISDAIPAVLLFLCSRAGIMNLYPFGLAFYASVFDKRVSYIAIISAFISMIGILSYENTIKYILSFILFWLYTNLQNDYEKNKVFSSMICGACILVSGCAVIMYNTINIFFVSELFAESIICSFMYIVFHYAASLIRYSKNKPTKQEIISGAMAVGVFISGLFDITLPLNINLSRCITSYVVMSIAYSCDTVTAGCGGLVAGIVCSMNNSAAITLMGMYGLGAIGANLFKFIGKYGIAIGFVAACSISTLYIGNSLSVPLSPFEVVISSLLFVLTPQKIHDKLSALTKRGTIVEVISKENRSREYICSRIANIRNALSSLSECFRGVSDKRLRMYNRDSASILNETCERVCISCPEKNKCWSENFSSTWKQIMNILKITERDGMCTSLNTPAEFKSMCILSNSFIAEFKHVYELYKTEKIHSENAVLSRDLLFYQYKEFATWADKLIEEFESGFDFSENDEQRISEVLFDNGISPREISVIESKNHGNEVYLRLNSPIKLKTLEDILTSCLGVTMIYETTLSDGLMKFCTGCEYEILSGSCSVTKDNEKISGDSLIFFRTPDYKFYIIICDGMGSGKNASRDSFLSGKLLEKFIRAGFSAKLAINMVNSSLALRLDHEGYSSVDMLCIDLFTGQADFYKTGGSKSYIRHENETETVFSEGLPAGMFKKLYIKGISKMISVGDIIVMMSDGASDVGYGVLSSDKIIKIADDEACDMNEFAKEIAKASIKKKNGNVSDDITVAAIKLIAV